MELPPVRRSPRIAAGVSLAAAAFVVTIAALEVVVRVVAGFDRNYLDEAFARPHPATASELSLIDLIRLHPDERVVYELRPGVRGSFVGRELAINSLGMRDVERAYDKAPGTFRIVGLGDSHAFGWGVDRDETFLAVLERLLDARFPSRRHEVWNLAVPGYNTVQEVQSFALRADRLAPDLVIINYVDNDMDLPNFLALPPSPWSLRRSFLADLVRRRLDLVRGGEVLPVGLIGAPIDERTRRYQIDPALIPARYRPLFGWENMERSFERLATLARRRRTPVVLLFNVDDYRARLAGRTADVRRKGVREFADRLRSKGYIVVDPQDRIFGHLRQHHLDSSALWISSADSHTNSLRHRLIADELLDALTRAGALTGREDPS